jgi:hypothetical protein
MRAALCKEVPPVQHCWDAGRCFKLVTVALLQMYLLWWFHLRLLAAGGCLGALLALPSLIFFLETKLSHKTSR